LPIQILFLLLRPTRPPRFPSEQRAQGGLFIIICMKKILYSKPYLSYSDQIELLKSRGMLFADETSFCMGVSYADAVAFTMNAVAL
jgi:hypothetical protein